MVNFVCTSGCSYGLCGLQFTLWCNHHPSSYSLVCRHFFQEIKPDSDALEQFQKHLDQTELIILDEISMVGRQFMGKINSRLCQGKMNDNMLGNVSCISVGDPGQCAAMHDQQMFDTDKHPNTTKDNATNAPLHSNVGLEVYGSFDECIILSTVYRLNKVQKN